MRIKIGTRRSPLALRQVEEILRALRNFKTDIEAEIIGIDTYGDKDRDTPISEAEGSDFFTREIDEALLRNEIDIAVHSAKDLPDDLRKGLIVASVTDSIDPYDVLVSKKNLKLDGLPHGAKVGTSSLRRKEALKKFREDFQIVDIRGNIQKRLGLLDNGAIKDLEAIVIAAAGLIRLGLKYRITQRIPFDILTPHPLQGSLAIVAKEDNRRIIELVKLLDNSQSIISG